MTRGDWTALGVDDVEAVPWRGTELVWRPVRAALGLHAFGAGAFTADRAGQEIVEPHVEDADGRGHEELYVVLRGAARFTLDGEVVEAPAGTLVRAGPTVHRSAVATDIPATVLALGGPPTFPVAGSEWTERARPFLRTDPARARRVLEEGLRELPDSPGLAYGVALLAAAEGRTADARAALEAALAAEPRLRAEAEREADLAPLLS